ncbi:MAG: D-arabinono-1,4-lactone oxidase [Myxococcota bacterium]|jgi:hypothetical protein
MTFQPGTDGLFHPRDAAEVAALTRDAAARKAPVRVVGANMSHRPAIHVDGYSGDGAPPPGVVVLKLDRLSAVEWLEERPDGAVLWVGAGCLLGPAYDDPTGASWKQSLTWQLQQKGYALDQMSGVSHQAVGGFLMTGSAGGSVRHALHDDILALELVDGTGAVHLLERDAASPADRERFFAAGVSMGLLGVLTRVKLRVGPTFNVVGAEDTTPFDAAACDFEGPGRGGRPSFAEYLRQQDYARILWWPQHGFERVQLWHAARKAPEPHFERAPFEVLSRSDALFGSLVYTVLGNLDDMDAVPGKLKDWYAELERTLDGPETKENPCAPPSRAPVVRADLMRRLREGLRHALTVSPHLDERAEHDDDDVKRLVAGKGARDGGDADFYDWIARLIAMVIDEMVDGGSGKLVAGILKRVLPRSLDKLLGLFLKDGSRPFKDSWMCGLPMDNGMSPTLWHTEFTELWVPLDKAHLAVKLLRDYFTHDDPDEAYRRTGAYAVELYAGPASEFWMSPGFGTPCLRINVFWFAKNAGSPRDRLYPPFWERLQGLDLRLHWGKHLPDASDAWRAHYRRVHPKLERFLELRAALDPNGLFLTRYWREHLGIG